VKLLIDNALSSPLARALSAVGTIAEFKKMLEVTHKQEEGLRKLVGSTISVPEPTSVMLAGIGCFAAYRWRSAI